MTASRGLKQKIIVIGAGLAGLTAALRLSQKGYNVEVYEARARVGGRIFTTWLKNTEDTYSLVEMGAQNIADGGEAFHLLSLAKELGLEIETTPVETLSFLVYHAGQYKDLKALLAASSFSEKNVDVLVNNAAKQCTSMSQLLDRLFPKNDFLKTAIQTRLLAYEGVEIKEQSIYHNIDTLKFLLKGGLAPAHALQNIVFKQIKEGNARLPLTIAEILKEKIHLNKPLIKVSSYHHQIQLTFNDSTDDNILCDKLILAIPASVYSDIQFDPAVISPTQLQQISNIPYGSGYKICIPVENIFNAAYRGIITDQHISFLDIDKKTLIMYCLNPTISLKQEIDIVQKKLAMLKTSASLFTTLEDAQFVHYDNMITHCWKEDNYAKGSYSGYGIKLNDVFNQVIAYQGVNIKKIFTPVDNRIFFIGEHTTLLDTIGTMEAAVESGERIGQIFENTFPI